MGDEQRATRSAAFVLIAAVVWMLVVVSPAAAHVDPDIGVDVSHDLVDEFWASITTPRVASAEFLPDGRMLTLTTTGDVHIVGASGGSATAHFTIPNVDSNGERGALDLVADPDFANNNTFYVYYSTPLPNDEARLRISSFVLGATGNETKNSEQVIWQNPGPTHQTFYHIGGSLNIGPDDKFYLTVGDGYDAPNGQNLGSVFGTTLRINRDGSVPNDNPFVGQTGAIGEIWAYGLRNPFRANFDELTGDLLVGDVGGNNAAIAQEEVNVIQAGANYGWATCEGDNGCGAGITVPVHFYGHDIDGGCCRNRSITGGEIYRGSSIPFTGNVYLYGDFADDSFSWVSFDNNYNELATGPLLPPGLPAGPRPVWVEVSPLDGWIYWINFDFTGTNQIRRMRYTGAPVNQPPTIDEASATPTSGAAPLTVDFTGLANDPDDPVTYSWDFGDGNFSTSPSPTHIYTNEGFYEASLTVTGGSDVISSPAIDISVGSPPTATILTPPNQTTFAAGDTITITGEGFAADGSPLDPGNLAWEIRLQHDNHEHPGSVGTGSSITFTVPTVGHGFEGDTGYLVVLTATGSNGLVGTDSIELVPRKLTVTIDTNLPSGQIVLVDGITHTTPHVIDTAENHDHTIEIAASICVDGDRWDFESWSSGAPRIHTLTVPAGTNVTLDATFTDAGPDPTCSTIGLLRISENSDRSEARPLNGARVGATGPRYFFFDENAPASQVQFWMDDPTTSGSPDRSEGTTPFDYAGGSTTVANLTDLASLTPGTHTLTAKVTSAGNGSIDLLTATFTVSDVTHPQLVVLDEPCAIYDSRNATSPALAGTLDGGDVRTVATRGPGVTAQGGESGCLPSDETAGIVVTISAVDPVAGGNLRLSSAGVVPEGGVVNYAANGLNNANTVTVLTAGDSAGSVDVAANGGTQGQGLPSTDVRIVATAYYLPVDQIVDPVEVQLEYGPVAPCTVADSRFNQGAGGDWLGPHTPGTTLTIDVIGSLSPLQGGGTNCQVPTTANAVLVNVVAINDTGLGHLAVGPTGSNPSEPTVAFAGLGMNNAATTIVPLSSAGTIDVAVHGEAGITTEVRVVVLGFYDDAIPANPYTVLSPCAAFDSRPLEGGAGVFAGARNGGVATTYQIAGSALPSGQGGQHGGDCGVPNGATAVLINLVAINPAAEGNLRSYATGTTPTGGVVNFGPLTPAMNNSNVVVIPLDPSGRLDVFVNTGPTDVPAATDLRGVVLGYFG